MAPTPESDAGDFSDEQREFLRTCAERPEDIDPEQLFERIESDEETVQQLGARALSRYVQEAPERLTDDGDRIVGYLDHAEENVRQSAVMTLRHLVAGDYDAFAEPPVKPLIDRLGKEDQPTSKRIAQTLVDLLEADDPELVTAVDTTADLFEGEKFEAGSGIQALVVLGRAFPGPVLARLTDRLDDDDADVRKYSVRTLAALAEDYPTHVADATTQLLAVLDDEDNYTREHALSALTVAAQESPDDLEDAVPTMVDFVDHDHDKVRRGAVRILAELGRADVDVSAATDALRGRLDDSDKIARRDACYALGILRAEEALDDLRALIDQGDLELQAVAESSIERITEGESDPPMADLDPGEIFTARL